MVQNNEDNNNIVFKQVLDGLDKVDTKIDELSYGKTEIKVEEKKNIKLLKTNTMPRTFKEYMSYLGGYRIGNLDSFNQLLQFR